MKKKTEIVKEAIKAGDFKKGFKAGERLSNQRNKRAARSDGTGV